MPGKLGEGKDLIQWGTPAQHEEDSVPGPSVKRSQVADALCWRPWDACERQSAELDQQPLYKKASYELNQKLLKILRTQNREFFSSPQKDHFCSCYTKLKQVGFCLLKVSILMLKNTQNCLWKMLVLWDFYHRVTHRLILLQTTLLWHLTPTH